MPQGLRDRPLFPAFPLLPRCKQKKRPGTHAAAGQDFTSMCSSQSTATDVLTQPTRTMCRIMRAARSRSRPCSGSSASKTLFARAASRSQRLVISATVTVTGVGFRIESESALDMCTPHVRGQGWRRCFQEDALLLGPAAGRTRGNVTVTAPDRQRVARLDFFDQSIGQEFANQFVGGTALQVGRKFNGTILALRGRRKEHKLGAGE